MNEADILATTYWHRADVLRKKEMKKGSFDDFEDILVYSGIACAVSFSGGSSQGPSDTTQAVEYMATLHTRPEIDIHAGDEIKATVEGHLYEFTAGEGVRYPSHNAYPLIRKDVAR